MELIIILSHGPVIWAVEMAAINLDTGKEEDRVMLHSFTDILQAKQYLARLQQLTGLDIKSEVCDESIGFISPVDGTAHAWNDHDGVVRVREGEPHPRDSDARGGEGYGTGLVRRTPRGWPGP